MKLPTLIALLAAACPIAAVGQSGSAIKSPVGVDGLVAELYVPTGDLKRRPAIVVLGGSGGGHDSDAAEMLATRGFVSLSLAFFGVSGLPTGLADIPLEYFDKGVSWLKAQPSVDASRLGIFGESKGAEAALLIASRNRDIRAVIAVAPASVSWQGMGPGASGAVGKGSWSLDGKSIPYLPYDRSVRFTTVGDLYVRSFAKRTVHPNAEIPVERINGSIFLICGGVDGLWPSCPMSDAILARLKAKDFPYSVQLEKYADAGHGVTGVPFTPVDPTVVDELGGTIGANARARADWWPKAIAFFQQTLQ